jgi:hypothetical protein
MAENTKTFDYTKLASALNITSRPVLCKDGTTQNQESSPNAIVMDACRNNGGRAQNQPVIKAVVVESEITASQNKMNKIKESATL